jgi:hypothetical protein
MIIRLHFPRNNIGKSISNSKKKHVFGYKEHST